MKRFFYEVYYSDENMHEPNYWEAKNYRAAKKEIFEAYKGDKNVKIIMIAEIKYEVDEYGYR